MRKKAQSQSESLAACIRNATDFKPKARGRPPNVQHPKNCRPQTTLSSRFQEKHRVWQILRKWYTNNGSDTHKEDDEDCFLTGKVREAGRCGNAYCRWLQECRESALGGADRKPTSLWAWSPPVQRPSLITGSL